MLSIALRNTSQTIFQGLSVIGRFWCSSNNDKTDLLSSQFHAQGLKHFPKSRNMNRQSTTAIFDVDKLITELEKQRIKMNELKNTLMIKNQTEFFTNAQCAKYFDVYSKLRERMNDVKINEQWGYRTVGWYNLQPFLENLIEDLLNKDKKTDQNCIIEAISWMKPQQHIIRSEESMEGFIKQKGKIDSFYSQLVLSHSIDVLKTIENIFQHSITGSKGKYYHSYLTNNIDYLIEKTSRGEQKVQDLLWIFEMYVVTLNDEETIIRKFQNYFINCKLNTRQEVIKTFIRIYNHTGRANHQIYELYLKPFIKQSPSNVIEVQVMNLQFMVHSEVNDEETLNEILKNIVKIARTQPISDSHRLHVHYLLHYLKIKDVKFSFPFQLVREFSQVCRTFEEDGTFAKAVAVELDEKSRREGVEYYNSSCVLKKKLIDSGKKEKQGEPINKVEGFKKYKDVKFCCLNIEFCVYDEQSKKGTILEKRYHRFVQSGRLVRVEEIKAEVLKHYGLEINYLSTQSQMSKKKGK